MQIYHKKLTASVALCALIVCGACKQETKDEKFKKDFEQFTLKECPKEIDLFIQLDSANYDIKAEHSTTITPWKKSSTTTPSTTKRQKTSSTKTY